MSETGPETYTLPEEAAENWLPAWFVPRMMQGNGGLALWLTTGMALPIERIERVHRASDGSVWLDVILTLPDEATTEGGLPATEPEATVNAAHVVAAFETGRYDPASAWDAAWVTAEVTVPRN